MDNKNNFYLTDTLLLGKHIYLYHVHIFKN